MGVKNQNNTQRRPFVLMLTLLSLLAIALSLSQQSITAFFNGTQEVHNLLETAYNIQTYDVILTTEAKLYAIDSDSSHQVIYDETLILLEEAFDEVVDFDPNYQSYIDRIDEANILLVDLELQAFDLSSKYHNSEAIRILLSQEYSQYKEMYALVLNELIEDINSTHNARYEQLEDTLNFNLLIIFSVFILIIIFLVIVYIVLERRMRFEQKLTVISHRLLSTDETIDSVFEYTLNEIKDFFKLDYVLILNHRGQGKAESYTSSLNKQDKDFDKNIKEQLKYFPSDVRNVERCSRYSLSKDKRDRLEILQASDVLRLISKVNESLALELVLISKHSHRLYSNLDQLGLQNLMDLLLLFLDQSSYKQNLYHLATYDTLTHILNRRSFLRELDNILYHHKKSQQTCHMIMMDLDLFKNVNDEYGHAVGDEVLRHFTSHAQACIRADDVFGRIGGEEFAIVLPNSTEKIALRVANRIRELIESQALNIDAYSIKYTVSLGVTKVNDNDTASTLMIRSDKALYKAKNNGRNQVQMI